MLVLFDIDMTLVTTHGAGIKAMEDAGREHFGEAFDSSRTEYGGRLDPLIIHDLLRDNGVDTTPEAQKVLREGYRTHLERRLRMDPAHALPGTTDLIVALEGVAGCTQGLLTGNFEETGCLKLRSAGFDLSPFRLNVWGDQSPHVPPAREHLPAVALERYRLEYGLELLPERVLVIGDTIHDVSCALANGCRVLGVATGHASAAELEFAGAHRVVNDLSQTGSILDWMLS